MTVTSFILRVLFAVLVFCLAGSDHPLTSLVLLFGWYLGVVLFRRDAVK